MVTATVQLTGFVGEMDRDAVLTHYERLLDSGLEQDEAIAQTLDAIVHGGRAKDFVLAFGRTSIMTMLSSRANRLRPSGYTSPDWKHEPVALPPERDNGNGRQGGDAQGHGAVPLSPEKIEQGFPVPGAGRVLDMVTLRKPRLLEGVLAGTWKVDGAHVKMGLLTAEQCFKLAESEKRAGNTRLTNARMFRRLGESLKPGEVVADRWDDDKVNTLYELSEVSA